MTEEAPLKSFASNRRAAACTARRARYLLNSFLFSVSGGPRSANMFLLSRVASNAFRHLNPAAWASSPIAFVSETPPEKCSAFCRAFAA